MTFRCILALLTLSMVPVPGVAQVTGAPAPPDVAAPPVPPDHRTATVSTEGTEFRVGSLLGAGVWSSDNHEIGKVEDVLFRPAGGGEPTVVLSVGGFLGWGETLVALPLSRFQHSERWVLPGVLAGTVRELPAFRFE